MNASHQNSPFGGGRGEENAQPQVSIKIILLLLTLALTPILLPAQAPYTGGEGDGHAAHRFFFLKGDPPGPGIGVEVYPIPAHYGEEVHIRAEDIHNKLEWQLLDLHGRKLTGRTYWGIQGTLVFDLFRVAVPEGIYILEILVDGIGHRRKLIVEAAE